MVCAVAERLMAIEGLLLKTVCAQDFLQNAYLTLIIAGEEEEWHTVASTC